MAAAMFFIVSLSPSTVTAEGNERLQPVTDPQIQQALQQGTKIRIAGTGLHSLPETPGTIDIELNPGETVERVLLYWQVFDDDVDYDTEIEVTVGGTTYPVIGEVIGEFVDFYQATNPVTSFYGAYSATIRADITNLGLIQQGNNSLTISGLEEIELPIPGFGDDGKNGAGIMLIYSDGSDSTLQLFDGHDAVWWRTDIRTIYVGQPVRFEFAASDNDRTADLSMFVASVEGQQSGEERQSVVEIRIGDSDVIRDINVLTSAQGDEWDDYLRQFTVPAGTEFVEVVILSESDPYQDPNNSDVNPASLVWLTAGLSLTEPEPEECDCRPKLLTFKYVGGSCDATSNDLGGHLKCRGDLHWADGIDIKAIKGKGRRGHLRLDNDWIAKDGTFTVSSRGKQHAQLPERLKLILRAGHKKQMLRLNTACDTPMQVGDQFGPLLLVDMETPEHCDKDRNQCRNRGGKERHKWFKKYFYRGH